MCELEKWMEKNKKLCVVTGIFGLLISPFLWPFFLAIIFQSLSVVMPFMVAWMLIKQPWKEKEEQNEEIRKNVQYGKNADTGKVSPDGAPADDMPESRQEEGQEPVKQPDPARKNEEPDGEGCLAIFWYKQEGRARILRIKEKLEKEGKNEFSISKDGICSVRREKGFQRVGVLRGYPGVSLLAAKKELMRDGFSVRMAGNYVWILWKKGGANHAL